MLKLRTLVVMSMVTVNSMAAPEISFSGYLDADVCGFTGILLYKQ